LERYINLFFTANLALVVILDGGGLSLARP
jgi:hypothetical protein